jgi:two-component system phosphate regulon sensor histidine kinase PhoR
MNDARYKWILYIIVIVILSTIGIQVYWNYKNYLNSKQQLINEVQISLDKAVDDYYAHLAEKNTLAFAFESSSPKHFLGKNGKLDSIVENINFSGEPVDSTHLKLLKVISDLKGPKPDSIFEFEYSKNNVRKTNPSQFEVITHLKPDSLNTVKFRTLTSKVVISLTNDSLSLKEIDSLLKIDLLRKHINIAYNLKYKDFKDSIRTHNAFKLFNSPKDSLKERHLLKATAESAFLPRGSDLTINFTNETQIILKRIFGGIIISLILVLAIISSLFYLLHIIRHQKQLAEVKNDLISNITHEFKTPIATISVALESIKDFKIIEDKDKTKKYLELSSGQLIKLNEMVEKLLETATLDSDSLTLHKESINIVDVLRTLVEKHQFQNEHKTIAFTSLFESIMASVDVFHFENAINNVLDNALKYGGNEITLTVEQNSFSFTVSISDTGNSITKANKEKIFEKFYRIPKGNTHDVKGFGIGLYYTKKIVEKHGGSIHLNLGKNLTTFKLSFPNE